MHKMFDNSNRIYRDTETLIREIQSGNKSKPVPVKRRYADTETKIKEFESRAASANKSSEGDVTKNPFTGKVDARGYDGNGVFVGVPKSGNTGRNVEKRSPTGVVQKGTQTSPASTPIKMDKGFDQMLAEMGLTDYYNGQAFTSNQLPTTNSNPFSANSTPKTTAFNPQAPGITGNTYDNYGSEGGASAASQPLIDGNEKFNPNVERIEGASTAPKRKSLDEALSDTSGMRVDSPELRELRARAAFLDAPDSMTGLKRAQATRGVVYAGGQHYIKDGDGKQAIDTADARRINSGKIGADALLQEYKDKITASGAQNPTEAGDSTNLSKPEGGDFIIPDKSLNIGSNNPTKGAPSANSQSNSGNTGPAIDFNNNNKQAEPKFNTDTDLLGGSRVKLPMNGKMF